MELFGAFNHSYHLVFPSYASILFIYSQDY